MLHVDSGNLWPSVIDDLQVAKGYETALGAALGDDLEAPVDPQAPMRWGGAAIDPSDPVLPEGVEALADHVTAPAELHRRLRQIGLVDRSEASRFTNLLKPGQRLVSREGDLWRWDGFAVAANAPTGAARRLAERNRLAEIEQELDAARADAETKRQMAAQAEAEAASANEAETAARNRWRELQRASDGARERHAGAERDLSHITNRRAALTEAKARLSTSSQEALTAHGEAQRALSELPAAAELEARLADVRAEITTHRVKVAEVRAEAQALTREAEIAKKRLEAIAGEQQAWLDTRERTSKQIAALDARLTEARTERDGLVDAPRLFEEKRVALIGEVQNAETAQREASDALAQGRGLAHRSKSAPCVPRSIRCPARANGSAVRRSAARVPSAASPISSTKSATCSKWSRPPSRGSPNCRKARSCLRFRWSKPSSKSCGANASGSVRSICAPKRNWARSRPSTGRLTTERDDLIEAIKRLRQGIQNLNREARERLLASFEVVNGHFKKLFKELFGGGEAELRLIESDDPLEAGLEIMAKPPGKKLQSLSLLSGGEQALTAMALIFAVFLTNPAPICVLDEVDAPLDDHNVERFCDLLDEMIRSTETRFVIITHNPITMARMNRLYGVTMAERGVSQLVSVDLEAAVEILDQAGAA